MLFAHKMTVLKEIHTPWVELDRVLQFQLTLWFALASAVFNVCDLCCQMHSWKPLPFAVGFIGSSYIMTVFLCWQLDYHPVTQSAGILALICKVRQPPLLEIHLCWPNCCERQIYPASPVTMAKT